MDFSPDFYIRLDTLSILKITGPRYISDSVTKSWQPRLQIFDCLSYKVWSHLIINLLVMDFHLYWPKPPPLKAQGLSSLSFKPTFYMMRGQAGKCYI